MSRKRVFLEMLNEKLDLVLLKLKRFELEVEAMSKELDNLKTKVQKNTDVTNSAVMLIQGLADQIRSLKEDPAALQQLADKLDADSTALAKAVTDNTPSGP